MNTCPVPTPHQTFRQWFASYIEGLSDGEKLIPETSLAARFGISPSSVARTIRRYVSRGAVVRIRGSGSYKTAVPSPGHPLSPPRRTSVEELADTLLQAIQQGELREGEALPPVAFVTHRFGVAPSTVIAAYRLLSRMTALRRIGKTWWIGTLPALMRAPGRPQAYIILKNAGELPHLYNTTSNGAIFQTVEEILWSSGVTVNYDYLHNLETLTRKWRHTPPQGVLFFRVNESSAKALAGHREALRRLKNGYGCRVVCDVGGLTTRVPLRCATLFERSAMSGAIARELIDFVQRKGYERVHWFQHLAPSGPRTRGSFTMLNGLWDYVRFRGMLGERMPMCGVATTLLYAPGANAQTLLSNRLPEHRVDGLLEKLGRLRYRDIGSEWIPSDSLKSALRTARTAGLWIFERDSDAAEALAWAAQNGIAVPEDCAIISRDRNPAYLRHGITRCDLDWVNTGYLMAHALLGDCALPRTADGAIAFRARVLGKNTT